MAKLAGRGLGFTGGTADKLESVKGVSADCPIDDFKRIVDQIGLCIATQTENLAPADKLIYALRGATATVTSIPLIASSVMSKKIAAGADAIVLDVKCGSGAFMKTEGEARALAGAMMRIGKRAGKRTVALITDMNEPLGSAIGNALEVREAIGALSGNMPMDAPLLKVSMLIAAHMLMLSGLADHEGEAQAMLLRALNSGAALYKLRELCAALGGDTACFENPAILENANEKRPLTLLKEGYVQAMDAQKLGVAAQILGAGRADKNDVIDPAVGIVMYKRIGDRVCPDEAVTTLHVNDPTHAEEAMALIREAISLSPAPVPKTEPVRGIWTETDLDEEKMI